MPGFADVGIGRPRSTGAQPTRSRGHAFDRDHVGIGVDVLGVDPEPVQQVALPDRQVAGVRLPSRTTVACRSPLQLLEVSQQRRIGGGVVDEVDAGMPGLQEPVHQPPQTAQAVEAVDHDRHVSERHPAQRPGLPVCRMWCALPVGLFLKKHRHLKRGNQISLREQGPRPLQTARLTAGRPRPR